MITNAYLKFKHLKYREVEIILKNGEMGSFIKKDGRGLSGISYFGEMKKSKYTEITYSFGEDKESLVEIRAYVLNNKNEMVMMKYMEYTMEKCPKLYKEIIDMLIETSKEYVVKLVMGRKEN